MTTIHDLAAQAEWEMEGVRRAVVRYEEAEAEADPMTLPPGKALVRSVVGPLAARISQLRDEAADSASTHGRPGGARTLTHTWPLQLVDPMKVAVIVLSVACQATVSRGNGAQGATQNSAIPMTAQRIAGALRDQVEYDQWEHEEALRNEEASSGFQAYAKEELVAIRAAHPKAPLGSLQKLAKAAARKGVPKHENRLKALQLRYPNLDRRVWAKWRAKLELARVSWSEVESIAIGTALIRALVDVAPEKFVIAERPLSGGVQYFLDTTPEVREVMNDVRERAMVARPLLMPMICPPVAWSYDA